MRKQAAVQFNGDIFIIAPIYRIFNISKKDLTDVFPASINNELLGKELKCALESSTLDWSHEVNSIKQSTDRYKIWKEQVIRKYKYKNKHALFRNMNLCNVIANDEMIIISPWRHDQLEGWGPEKGDEKYDITIPADSDHKLIGETLRLALERAANW
jgi:hypothetical protein